MFDKDTWANLMSVSAITLYSLSLSEILTFIVLTTSAALNIIRIIEKAKNKNNNIKEEE